MMRTTRTFVRNLTFFWHARVTGLAVDLEHALASVLEFSSVTLDTFGARTSAFRDSVQWQDVPLNGSGHNVFRH